MVFLRTQKHSLTKLTKGHQRIMKKGGGLVNHEVFPQVPIHKGNFMKIRNEGDIP